LGILESTSAQGHDGWRYTGEGARRLSSLACALSTPTRPLGARECTWTVLICVHETSRNTPVLCTPDVRCHPLQLPRPCVRLLLIAAPSSAPPRPPSPLSGRNGKGRRRCRQEESDERLALPERQRALWQAAASHMPDAAGTPTAAPARIVAQTMAYLRRAFRRASALSTRTRHRLRGVRSTRRYWSWRASEDQPMTHG